MRTGDVRGEITRHSHARSHARVLLTQGGNNEAGTMWDSLNHVCTHAHVCTHTHTHTRTHTHTLARTRAGPWLRELHAAGSWGHVWHQHGAAA